MNAYANRNKLNLFDTTDLFLLVAINIVRKTLILVIEQIVIICWMFRNMPSLGCTHIFPLESLEELLIINISIFPLKAIKSGAWEIYFPSLCESPYPWMYAYSHACMHACMHILSFFLGGGQSLFSIIKLSTNY